MSTDHALAGVRGEAFALMHAYHEALSEELDAPFGIWMGDGSDMQPMAGDGQPVQERAVGGGLEVRIAEAAAAQQTICLQLNDQQHLVAVPVVEDAAAPIVVAGIVNGGCTRLLTRLVHSILRRVQCEMELRESRGQMFEFAEQVTNDFEELTWLRSLAEHIEVCDIQNDLATVSSAMLPTLCELIGAEAIAVFAHDTPYAAGEAASTPAGRCRYVTGDLPISQEACTELIEASETVTAGRPLVRNAADPHRPGSDTFGLRSFILVRVCRSKREYGWLLVMNRRMVSDGSRAEKNSASCLSEWEFGTFEAGLLNAAAIMLATQSHNAELFRDKEHLLIGVVRALINAIDAKDAYTCGHSDRVALIAKRLAMQMGLDRRECERVYMAGLLHDIGKIGVPDHVLGKPDRLTEEEFAQIKLHPEIGYSILKHVRQLQYVLPGVLHHHESVDGSGYPMGLEGQQIPLYGRILAVADSYDAMTSTRAYRKAMPQSKAEAILREGAGKQWDSDVVEAFFSALPEIHEICDAHSPQRQTARDGDPLAVPPGLAHGDSISAAFSAMSAG